MTSGSWILEGDEDSIDHSFTVLVRVIRRCLPAPTAPCSLAGLVADFRPCFTAPTFQTFIGLVVGLIAQTRRRTVCGLLTGAGLDQVWHHSRTPPPVDLRIRCGVPAIAIAAFTPFVHQRPLVE